MSGTPRSGDTEDFVLRHRHAVMGAPAPAVARRQGTVSVCLAWGMACVVLNTACSDTRHPRDAGAPPRELMDGSSNMAQTDSDSANIDPDEAAADPASLPSAQDGATPDAPDPPAFPSGSSELGTEFATRDSAYLFDQTRVRTYELFLRPEDLAILDADPLAEAYVPGQLQFEGGLIADVGVRYKGSTGSFVGCLSGNTFPPTGSKTCVKLGIKIKVDYTRESARFFGQKKLQFHAMNLDRSLLRERFGYALFNQLSIHAPRTAHVRLLVNGKLAGVFLLVEVIDSPFTESRFDDGGDGNLYKEVWPVGSDESRYLAGLEAGQARPKNAAKIAAFAAELGAADDAALPGVLARWLDVDYMARFVAVDRALRHDDGPYHWYCSDKLGADAWLQQRAFAGTRCGNHNYYWYEGADSERLWPIPWDLDNSIPLGAGFTAIVSAWDDLAADCSAVINSALGGQMPGTCDPLLRGVALSLHDRVVDNLSALALGPLSDTAIDATLAPWIDQLAPLVAEAHAAHPTEEDVSAWSAQVSAMRTALHVLRDAALVSTAASSGVPVAVARDGGSATLDATSETSARTVPQAN